MDSSAASESKTSLELCLFVAGKLLGHGIVNAAKSYFHSLFRDWWWLQEAVSGYDWKYVGPIDYKPLLSRLEL